VIKEIINQGMEFVIIGAKKPSSLAALPISELGWSLETETELIHSLNIGIMPLPDTPFERGKCGYKLIQYMACGIPVVASPVGVNRHLVTNGENGFLASDLSEWSQYINKLSADPNLRRKMGQRGRVLIERDYNLEKWAPKIIQILGG
jgi:glycosyltransferase involved in cell wall biosynthesis